MLSGTDSERLREARRILVVGPSGSGKTHLALRLGELLDLPLVHLDAHRWRPGWTALPDLEWRAAVVELLEQPAWIMDGTYESTLGLRVPAAEAVVMLERSRVLCLLGVLRRRLFGRHRRADAPPGERLDRAFLRYVWRYPVETRPVLLAHLRAHEGNTLVVLEGRRQARRLVRNLRELQKQAS